MNDVGKYDAHTICTNNTQKAICIIKIDQDLLFFLLPLYFILKAIRRRNTGLEF